MSSNSSTNNNTSYIKLEFSGFDPNVQKTNAFNKKIADIKSKISSSITKNINYENGKSNITNAFKILEDTDGYTVITLRCGANKVMQNTIPANQYNHIQILQSLQGMLEHGDFDDDIVKYANRSNTKKTKKSKSTKSKKASAE
jgi:hypothetical protein